VELFDATIATTPAITGATQHTAIIGINQEFSGFNIDGSTYADCSITYFRISTRNKVCSVVFDLTNIAGKSQRISSDPT
jgi:hypothetical protein